MPKDQKYSTCDLCDPCIHLHKNSAFGCAMGLVRHEQWSWAGKSCRRWRAPAVARVPLDWSGEGPRQMLEAMARKARPKTKKQCQIV